MAAARHAQKMYLIAVLVVVVILLVVG